MEFGTSPSLSVEYFFDRQIIKDTVSAENRKILSQYGAYTRRTAKGLIRKPRRKTLAELSPAERKTYDETKRRPFASSKPGEAPRDQTGVLRDNILFAYDPARESVVIGPRKISTAASDIPRILEEGGRTTIASGFNAGKTVYIAARPYLTPAQRANLPILPSMWRDRF